MTVTDERLRRLRASSPEQAPRIPASALPPGPRWPALLQTIALVRFRHTYIPALHRRYGDVFTVRILPRGSALVLFTRPEHVKEIFAGDPEVFHAGKGNAVLAPVMGERSLLLVDSDEHRRARRLLMPAFNGAALRGYEALVTDIARREVDSWVPGSPFRALDRMNALTLEVILRVVFGVTDEGRLAELRPLVNRTVDVSPAVLFGCGYEVLERIGPWRRALENQRELDRVMYAEIAERRRAADLAGRSDVLSRLLQVGLQDGPESAEDRPLSDDELRDQLVTLLLAGHETTASALSWALYELGRDRDQLERARKAAVDGDDAYLEAVMKESLRLHPVIPMVVRYLMAPATIGGFELPRGTNVGPSILVSHAREDNFDEPDRFLPERFLDDGPAVRAHVAANTWIPFGGGVRRCIGAGFSLMEGVAVLREVLGRYEVALPAGRRDRPRVRNITSVPRDGARIVVHEPTA